MYRVEITYPTKLGNLTANMSTSQVVETREDAERVISALRTMPSLNDEAEISMLSVASPTADEALRGFSRTLGEYPPVRRK